jgi:hypothetical protein
VLRSISRETGGIDREAALQFLARLPDVLGRCDEDIYNLPFAAEAYAFVHLVDRYRRFWDVLEALLRTRNLPVRDISIDVLDVGTGPAPALYAVNDFFEELRAFAQEAGDCQRLCTPAPRLRSVEDSTAMVRLVHNLSEFTRRPGPFQPDMSRFEGFNPPEARAAQRLRLIDELIDRWEYSEQEARIQAHLDQADVQAAGRYHLCIFSNFLTSFDQVLDLASELAQVFRALKPRGLVLVVGGTGGEYPDIYESLDDIAKKSNVQLVSEVPSIFPCDYHNAEAMEIKQLYRSVFGALSGIPLDTVERELPPDLWSPDTPLKGPTAFGVRVYRAPNRPPGARFTKRIQSGGSIP